MGYIPNKTIVLLWAMIQLLVPDRATQTLFYSASDPTVQCYQPGGQGYPRHILCTRSQTRGGGYPVASWAFWYAELGHINNSLIPKVSRHNVANTIA